MLGVTALSCTGVLFLAITTNCLQWHSLDATNEITRSSEMEPWDWEAQPSNYEDLEKPVSKSCLSLYRVDLIYIKRPRIIVN
jgi:hypothetical protein